MVAPRPCYNRSYTLSRKTQQTASLTTPTDHSLCSLLPPKMSYFCILCFSPAAPLCGHKHCEICPPDCLGELPDGYIYICSHCHERKFGFPTDAFLTITTWRTLALSKEFLLPLNVRYFCVLCFSPAAPSCGHEHCEVCLLDCSGDLPDGYIYICSDCHDRKFGFPTESSLTVTTWKTLALSRGSILQGQRPKTPSGGRCPWTDGSGG